jgi:NACalpha-BTF3-like transcription factor
MSDLELFKGNSLVNSDLFKDLLSTNDNLAGGGSSMRRISFKGSRFRELVGGEQVNVNSSGSLNVVVLDAAKVSRTYYAGTYDPENPAPPACWSQDTQTPAPEVPQETRQASRCADCPQNVRGSGQGDTRACRFSQRIAVALENSYDKVYQVQLSATSVFGDAKNGNMPMQAYARYLKAHSAPIQAVVTTMHFDENSDVPKLFFKAARPLDEPELKEVLALRGHEDVTRALTMTVSQSDGVKSEKKAEPKKAEPKKSNNVLADEDDNETVEEPKKVTKKEEVKASDDDLGDLVDAWDDDE